MSNVRLGFESVLYGNNKMKFPLIYSNVSKMIMGQKLLLV